MEGKHLAAYQSNDWQRGCKHHNAHKRIYKYKQSKITSL